MEKFCKQLIVGTRFNKRSSFECEGCMKSVFGLPAADHFLQCPFKFFSNEGLLKMGFVNDEGEYCKFCSGLVICFSL